jgi:hypothetical protein
MCLCILSILSRQHSIAAQLPPGAPARFSGRVGRLKKNKDSARSADEFFALPTLDPSLPTLKLKLGVVKHKHDVQKLTFTNVIVDLLLCAITPSPMKVYIVGLKVPVDSISLIKYAYYID